MNKDRKKGKLRIFLGMTIGVGKTSKMLDIGKKIKPHSDIIIGFMREERINYYKEKTLIFEKIKEKKIQINDLTFSEIDIEKILNRNPKIAIIDEIAHTNSTNSKHIKRYQDILEILNNGIDVWTTLNIENIDSQALVVESITGKKIEETIPDFVVEMADKIEIVDIDPSDIIERFNKGKIYEFDEISIDIKKYYREGNLRALREITLQYLAKFVDKKITNYRNIHSISEVWKVTDKLLVAISPSPYSAYLIKWTKKTAFTMNAPWIAVYVESSRKLSEVEERTLNNNIELARQLGAEVVSTVNEDIVKGILKTVKEYNISQIVVGKPLLFSFKSFFAPDITERLIKESKDVDVYIVSQPGSKEKNKKNKKRQINLQIKEIINSVFFLVIVAFFAFLARNFLNYWLASIFFVLYIIYIATTCGRLISILISILSAVVWNFAFIHPQFIFSVSKNENSLVYLMFFIVAVLTGNLNTKLNLKEKIIYKREKKLSLLYELSREIAKKTDFEKIMYKSIEYLEKYFNNEAILFIRNPEKEIFTVYPEKELNKELEDIAMWVIKNEIPVGKGTGTFGNSEYYFYPINSTNQIEGVILLKADLEQIQNDNEFLKTISFIIGSSIMKEKIYQIKQKDLVEEETEKLYSIILSSISHELKTPVTSISLSASGLQDEKLVATKEMREILIKDILEANDRLNRVFTNLLDMTRIESGKLKLNLQWNDLNDLLNVAVGHLESKLRDYKFVRKTDVVLPPVKLDFGFIEQVITNILYNSMIHTKIGTHIYLTSGIEKKYIFIEISDNGGGIKDIDKVFKKFYKEKPKKTGGLGIGLSICKSIIEFHKWKLEAYNNDIDGATFKILIPIKEGEI